MSLQSAEPNMPDPTSEQLQLIVVETLLAFAAIVAVAVLLRFA